MQQLNKLSQLDGETLINSILCYDVADSYHRHRFEGHAEGKKSPVASFKIDKSLKHALALQLEQGGIPTGFFGALSLVLSTQACSNFRPGFAKYISSRYAKERCTVLDTSAGYGGRMLGFIAAFKVGQYIGIDPHVATHKANLLMGHDLGFSDRVLLINQPAEDVIAGQLQSSADLCFTSPPYFCKEIYTDEPTQSRLRYPGIDAWVDGFLRPMIQLQHDALKKGGMNVINIADVKIKSKTYPLEQLTRDVAADIGFKLHETLNFEMTRRFGANQDTEAVATEPVLVFKK